MTIEKHGTEFALRPTRTTLALRRCIVWQIYRFFVINLRMTVMILKSHDTRIRPHGASEPAAARVD